MAGSVRAGWRPAAAVLPLVVWLAWGCGSAETKPPAGGGVGLDDGPTRWLMLPDEQKQVRKLGSTREAVAFIEEFWRRRDPDPTLPGNEFSRAFYERVEAADRLYSEGGTRGSLTDRGRALILLGAPSTQRYGQKAVPTWDPGRPGSRPTVQARNIVVETWVYPLTDLPPELVKLVEDEAPVPEVILVFTVETRGTYLTEGEDYLELAVRAAVRE